MEKHKLRVTRMRAAGDGARGEQGIMQEAPRGRHASAGRSEGNLVVVEAPRFWSDDIGECLAQAQSVMELRRHTGRSVLVSETGQVQTPPLYCDTAVSLSPTGLVTRARQLTQAALGHQPGGDFVAAHWMYLAMDGVKPWTDLAFGLRPQIYTGTDLAGTDSRVHAAIFDAGNVASNHAGTHFAFVEFRGGAEDHDRYAVWEEAVATGSRRCVRTLPDSAAWEVATISYSPDGNWLLLAPGSSVTGPVLIARDSGLLVTLPVQLLDATWNPGAGPGHLLAVVRQPGQFVIGDYQLGTAAFAPLGAIHDPGNSYLCCMAVSRDGTSLAAIAPIGLDATTVERFGTAGRAVVIDLRTFALDLVLPPTFNNGVERDHTGVMWTQPPSVTGPFEIAGQLLAAAEPGRVARPLDGRRLESFQQRFQVCLRDILFAAADGRVSLGTVGQEVHAYAVAALGLQPELIEAVAGLAAHVQASGSYATGDSAQSWQDLEAFCVSVADGHQAPAAPVPVPGRDEPLATDMNIGDITLDASNPDSMRRLLSAYGINVAIRSPEGPAQLFQ